MEQIAINILPKGAKPVCHSSQFDEGRQIMFNLFNDKTPYTLSGTETISVLVHKPDGAEVVDSVTNTSDSYVIWDVSADACELSGVCECELSIVENGIVLGSKNFTMKVEEDAYGGRNIEVRTTSGRIASFSTNMVEAFKSLQSDINPVQDLHGYSKPWSGGGGKNKLDCTATTQTINGVTFTVNSDGTIKANGTATGGSADLIVNQTTILADGTYILNGCPLGGSYTTFYLRATRGVTGLDVGNGTGELSYASGTRLYVYIHIAEGVVANNLLFKPMVRLATESDSSFAPYSNICPISGFSALNVTRTGVNLCFDAYGNKASESTYLYPSGDNLPIVVNNSLRTAYAYVGKNQDVVVSFASAPQRSLAYGLEAYPTLGVICHSLSVTALSSTSFKVNSGNYDYIAFYYCNDLANIPSDCQIELGSTATDYKPYNGQTATVNFGQTVYGGVADVTNGKVTLTHGIVDLGTLDWITEDSVLSGLARVSQNQVIPLGAKYLQTPICTQFEGVYTKSYVNFNNGEIGFSNSEQSPFIRARSTEIVGKTNTQIKALMSGVMLCYELATPIEITTTPENLTALSGQTNNVYSDTNGDTTVEYYIEV